jgi:hypothetical protein
MKYIAPSGVADRLRLFPHVLCKSCPKLFTLSTILDETLENRLAEAGKIVRDRVVVGILEQRLGGKVGSQVGPLFPQRIRNPHCSVDNLFHLPRTTKHRRSASNYLMNGADSKQIIVNAIYYTIQQLEHDPDIRPDDPALDTLKRLLVRRIAEIDMPQGIAPAAALPEAVVAEIDTAKVATLAVALPETAE